MLKKAITVEYSFLQLLLKSCKSTDYFFSFTGHELIPNGAYNGQKLIRLVKTNTPASTNSTMPNTPEMVSVK